MSYYNHLTKIFFNYCYEKEIQSIIVEGGEKHFKILLTKDIGMKQSFTSNKKLNQGIPSPKFDVKK